MSAERGSVYDQYWKAFNTLTGPLGVAVMFTPVEDDRGRMTDFLYTIANRTYLWLTGQTRHDLVGSALSTTDPHLASAGAISHLAETMTTGFPKEFDVRWDFPGRPVVYAATSFKIGASAALVGRPRNEQKIANQQQQPTSALPTSQNVPDSTGHTEWPEGPLWAAAKNLLEASTMLHAYAAPLPTDDQLRIVELSEHVDGTLRQLRNFAADLANRPATDTDRQPGR